mmetsp:Transcript_41684/g.98898  ORF Transcript_41684/g.98898 Transcript_41684/m.98898 type:complete len:797 (-) Transcript_41684:385-2775(-)
MELARNSINFPSCRTYGRLKPSANRFGLETFRSGSSSWKSKLLRKSGVSVRHRFGRYRSLTCVAETGSDASYSRPLVPGQTVSSCSFEIGGKQVTIETGEIGRQANGAAVTTCGETVIYTTACADKGKPGDGSFLPLSVQYMERYSAAGRTSGGFIKRDGRQKDGEVLTSRLVDRPLRPMFCEGWAFDTQVLQWVLSFDGVNSPEPLAITAAGAALAISDIPLKKPVAGVRVGMIGQEFVVNPTIQQMQDSPLDLTIAGTEDAVLMIEGFSDFLTEEQLLESVRVGAEAVSTICKHIQAWADKVGKPKSTDLVLPPQGLEAEVRAMAKEGLDRSFRIAGKQERGRATDAVKEAVFKWLVEDPDGPMHPEVHVSTAFKKVCSEVVRNMVLDEKIRTDGRGLEDVRPIACRAGVLPRTHGSALFTRGETQALAVVTLGNTKSALRVDGMQSVSEDDDSKSFYLQYFFPPSSVGETGRHSIPGRRELGHGQLAERALLPVCPDASDFTYTIRAESTITESNGSSSMASVCGACLAMMDAGVPVKAMVAGVAMGLVLKDDGSFVVLTDILGTEDALGDMDFKVAGSREGVTAFQMDIKVEGITIDIMKQALEQARRGRLHILDRMGECRPYPAGEVRPFVPRVKRIEVPVDDIALIIGSKGATIKALIEESGAESINVSQDGTVEILAPSSESVEKAVELIKQRTTRIQAGQIYRKCKVVSCVAFGCFIEIMPGKEGLCHISELDLKRVNAVEDVVKRGDLVDVKVLAVASNGKISLSRKAVLADQSPEVTLAEEAGAKN